MKTSLFLFALLFSLPAFASDTACVGAGNSDKLDYSYRITRGGYFMSAVLNKGTEAAVSLRGLHEGDGSLVPSAFELADGAGQVAILKITYTPVRRFPCGRGSCDEGQLLRKEALLTYLGVEKKFICHDTPGL